MRAYWNCEKWEVDMNSTYPPSYLLFSEDTTIYDRKAMKEREILMGIICRIFVVYGHSFCASEYYGIRVMVYNIHDIEMH